MQKEKFIKQTKDMKTSKTAPKAKKENIKYNEGDKIELLVENGKEDKPIGWTKDGLICLFNSLVKTKIEIGFHYECEISKVKENCLIVTPIRPTQTFKEVANLDRLAQKFKVSKLK